MLLSMWWQQGGDEMAALQSKIAEIEGKVADGASDQLTALAGRVDALESGGGAAAAGDGDLVSRVEAIEAKAQQQDTVEARLAALESGGSAPDLTGRLAEIETALEQLPGDSPQVAELEERIAKLESDAASGSSGEQAASAVTPAANEETLEALQERVASLEASLPEAANKADSASSELAATSAKLQDAETRLTQIDQRLSAAEQAEAQLKQLSSSVDQLTSKISADAQQTASLASEVSSLGERLSGTETKIADAERNRSRAATLALVVGQLESAIQAAKPYQTQVEALSAMAGGDSADEEAIKHAVGALEPGAAAGVPSIAALRQSFEGLANEIVHAARATDGDNLLNRAADNLMRLVTVRPVGDDVRGDTVEARVARAEAALAKGDLAAAVSEVEQLEGRPATIAAPWLEQAKARLDADQAVVQLRAQATDLLRQNP